MSGRINSVKIQTHVHVSTGVGEGSVPGPLIFLIFILEVSIVMEIVQERLRDERPDIADQVELHSVQFADDCTNAIAANDEDQVQDVMEICSQEQHLYFTAQGMKLNLTKEEHIVHAPSLALRTKEGGEIIKL